MNYVGDFAVDETVYLNFASYDSNGASVTLTGLATSDIEIYKNGGTTQRSSDAGYTVSTDFDTITGIHAISIDTSDDTDSGFFAAGNDYVVIVSSVTIDTQTVSFVAGSFSIENRFMRGTDSAALATALATVDTNVDAILVDTGTTIPGQISGLNDIAATDVWSAVTRTLTANTNLNDPTAAAIADAVLDEALSGHTTAGTLGKAIADIEADTSELQTDDVPGLIAALNDISVGDILTTQITESYAANGVLPTLAEAVMMLYQRILVPSKSGTTLSVLNNAGATAATFTVDDADNPQVVTRTT